MIPGLYEVIQHTHTLSLSLVANAFFPLSLSLCEPFSGRTGPRLRGLLPPPRTKWTHRVPHPVLIGHASSLPLYFIADGSLSGAGPERNSSPRGPRARRPLVCLAWNHAPSFPFSQLVVIKRIVSLASAMLSRASLAKNLWRAFTWSVRALSLHEDTSLHPRFRTPFFLSLSSSSTKSFKILSLVLNRSRPQD